MQCINCGIATSHNTKIIKIIADASKRLGLQRYEEFLKPFLYEILIFSYSALHFARYQVYTLLGQSSILLFSHLLCFGLIFFMLLKNDCLKVIPERCAITYINESYATNVSLTVRRAKRGGPYVGNVEWVTEKDLGNNITVDLVFYQYLHNEYRRSFVEGHYNACDLINKDPYVGFILRRGGLNKCPVPKGKTSLKNIVLDVNIPSVFPFEHCKAEMSLTDDIAGVVFARGYAVLTIKEK